MGFGISNRQYLVRNLNEMGWRKLPELPSGKREGPKRMCLVWSWNCEGTNVPQRE